MVIQVLEGPDRGKAFELKQGDNTIGRGPQNDVVLTDRAVSSTHATITVTGDGVSVRDHSSNGTFVNGAKVAAQQLKVGDRIRLGRTDAQVRTEPAPDQSRTVMVDAPEEKTRIRRAVEPAAAAPSPAAVRPAEKKEDSGPFQPVQPPPRRAEPPAPQKPPVAKPPNKALRLALVGTLAFVSVITIMLFTTPQPKKKRRVNVVKPRERETTETVLPDTSTLPSGRIVLVETEYGRIDTAAYTESVRHSLGLGRSYYDASKRPGSLLNAIVEWEGVRGQLRKADAEALGNCLKTAKAELDDRYSRMEKQALTLTKQERYAEAAQVLDEIMDEFPRPDDKQFRWAKNERMKIQKHLKK
jgi:pSer/pThr/pTyr-binding forkhead associated (FHA) protein